jgi:hypothetical protein
LLFISPLKVGSREEGVCGGSVVGVEELRQEGGMTRVEGRSGAEPACATPERADGGEYRCCAMFQHGRRRKGA